MFNVYIQNACHGQMYRPSPAGSKGGGGGGVCTGGYKGVRALRPESVAGGGIENPAENSL